MHIGGSEEKEEEDIFKIFKKIYIFCKALLGVDYVRCRQC